MREIELTQGKIALVDDEDFERVNQFKWRAHFNGYHWYARRDIRLENGKRTVQHMHRFVRGIEHGDPRQVDHINRSETLDNRRSNLRIATRSQNLQNRDKQKNNTSGWKGVCWHKASKKWVAKINHQGKRFDLGLFDTTTAAAAAYNDAALMFHGKFAVLNDLSNVTKAGLVVAA